VLCALGDITTAPVVVVDDDVYLEVQNSVLIAPLVNKFEGLLVLFMRPIFGYHDC
jgi:hypothetical protein